MDPRYKGVALTNAVINAAKTTILDLVRSNLPETEPNSPTAGPSTEPDAELEPPAKRLKTNVWECFDAAVATAEASPVTQEIMSVTNQLETYLREPRLDRKAQPLDWWRINANRFPDLAALARRHLSAPPTSVASERLFSHSGNVLTDLRNRLTPANAERLIFLHDNLKILNFEY